MTTPRDFEQYAIQHHDGRWLYHLPDPSGREVSGKRTGIYADGQPMHRLVPLADSKGDWYVADHPAERITATYQPYPTPLRYALSDETVLSVRYPAELSVAERNKRTDVEDAIYRLYTAVTEDLPPVEYVYEGPFVVLEGTQPPAPGSPRWVADIPRSLTERPEFHHCFPGHIAGLRDSLAEQIKRMGHVQHCFNGYKDRPAGLHVTIRVPFAQPKSRWIPNIGRGGRDLKSGRNAPITVSQEMYLPVPDRVAGPTYAVALAQWELQEEFWLQVARDAAVKACNNCGGTGHILDADEAAEGAR